MLLETLKSNTRLPIALTLLAMLAGACSSRYRLDFYQVNDGERRKIKIEQTQYVPGSVLSLLEDEIKVVSGDGNVAVVTTGTRGERTKREIEYVLSFDEYLRTRLYFQFSWPLRADTTELRDNSLMQLMGHYEWTPAERVFLPQSGRLIVDSVTSKNVFATVSGVYRNSADITYEFDGSFKVKISD